MTTSRREGSLLQTPPPASGLQVALPEFFVGSGTCGRAAGADRIPALLREELAVRGQEAVVKQVGCIGMCRWEPIVDVRLPGGPRLSFGPCDERNLKRILHEYVDHGIVPGDLLLGVVTDGSEGKGANFEAPIQPSADEPAFPGRPPLLREHPMMRLQKRMVLQDCGLIDPESLEVQGSASEWPPAELVTTGGAGHVVPSVHRAMSRPVGGEANARPDQDGEARGGAGKQHQRSGAQAEGDRAPRRGAGDRAGGWLHAGGRGARGASHPARHAAQVIGTRRQRVAIASRGAATHGGLPSECY
ncbi:hypothetical protein LIP_0432 [Limnochorda pilosa]|uniref:(2Fe-2S) ferredoxin domain-containing protein n=1 Tax=Limnochorda pilosa TaxID=1555112 RepID=A0A0K2SHJ0_LIMPI|nr:hypothetical protein LIP_0432 [Limnochorda pilosa]